jgi:hypothetical protein
MNIDLEEGEKFRVITDHNGNPCGIVCGRELPWPLIEMIEKAVPTTGYHGVNYHIKKTEEVDSGI